MTHDIIQSDNNRVNVPTGLSLEKNTRNFTLFTLPRYTFPSFTLYIFQIFCVQDKFFFKTLIDDN